MKVEISYMFDASELGGQNLVTFEESGRTYKSCRAQGH